MANQEHIQAFAELRDACDLVVKALESDDVELAELAVGKFMVVMLKMQSMS